MGYPLKDWITARINAHLPHYKTVIKTAFNRAVGAGEKRIKGGRRGVSCLRCLGFVEVGGAVAYAVACAVVLSWMCCRVCCGA